MKFDNNETSDFQRYPYGRSSNNHMAMALAYIGLGANLGDRRANLREALDRLDRIDGISVTGKSAVLETDPVLYLDQPKFLNQVASVETGLAPMDLLAACLRVESEMGRTREIPKGPRTIDLDILLYGRLVVKNDRLAIPHPAIRSRDFVMRHLVELDPDLADPETGEKYSLICSKTGPIVAQTIQHGEDIMTGFKNIHDFRKAKESGAPVSVITCYDHAFARIIEGTDIDVILVGDSLGMVIAGFDSTLPVTLDQMIYHSTIVRRGAPSKFIVTDLPFMSYHVSQEDTLRNCGRVMKECGSNAVKLEGGRDFRPIIEALVKASIPVMGHLGLTPQSIHKLGGYTVQGKDDEQRQTILEDAMILENAGVFSIVLEMVPEVLAKEISRRVKVPTIGIGAGRYTDGQVLVLNDMLGLDERFNPKFLKKYADLNDTVKGALTAYDRDVKERKFPEEKNAFK